VPPNCHQQLSTDIKNWLWQKDRELVTVCGAYVLSRILFRRRSRLARPDIWRFEGFDAADGALGGAAAVDEGEPVGDGGLVATDAPR